MSDSNKILEGIVILGCLKNAGARNTAIANDLKEGAFESSRNRKLYSAIMTLHKNGDDVSESELFIHAGKFELQQADIQAVNGFIDVALNEVIDKIKKLASNHTEAEVNKSIIALNTDHAGGRITFKEYQQKVMPLLTRAGRNRSKGLSDICKPLSELGWLHEPPPKQKALLTLNKEPWMPTGKTGMLVGTGGTGKTQALIQLAISVATGKPWLGSFEVENKGPVILALGEEGPDDMRRRIWYAVNAAELTDVEHADLNKNLFPLPLAGQAKGLIDEKRTETTQAAEWETLIDSAPAGPWSLICIDPASRFMGPDGETSNAAATRFVEVLESWAHAGDAEVKPMILFAHHTSKGSSDIEALHNQDIARGSSALTDGVRWQANMVSVTGGYKGGSFELVGLNCTKSNDGIKGEPVWLKRMDNGVLELEDNEGFIKAIKAKPDTANKQNRKTCGHLSGSEKINENAYEWEKTK
jgi:regulatory protein RepA